MTTVETMVVCDYCREPRPVSETFEPIRGGTIRRCRDAESCKRTQLYQGSNMEPPAFDRPARVAGTCAICGASQPPGGVFERSAGVRVCLDRPGCDARSIESQYLTAHGDDGQAEYTSAMMRAVAMASVPQVDGTAPADVTERAQASASADYAYALAAAGRRR